MTQDFEPTKITENTPEPEDTSLIFISRVDGSEGTVAENTEDGWTIPGQNGAVYWEQVRSKFTGWDMQSLDAHDAQIRADAWDEGFTEGRDLAVSGRPMSRNNPYKEQKQ